MWSYLDTWIETLGTVPPYRSRGVVSGTGHVMDMFWPRLRARAVSLPDRGAYGRLIGCWMLPVDAAEGLPETLFFRGAGGAMRAVHALTCQVLHAYADEAVVPRSSTSPLRKLVQDDGWCDGLHDFIRAMCEGTPINALDGSALEPTPREEGPCGFVRIHYADNHFDSMHGFDRTDNPCAGTGGWTSEPHFCAGVYSDSLAYASADVLRWDEYTLGIRAVPYRTRDGGGGGGSFGGAGLPGDWGGIGGGLGGGAESFAGREYITFTDLDSPGSTGRPWPRSDTTFSTARGSSTRRAVTFQPAHLAFDAEVCDVLMFMAQICLDRARTLCRHRTGPDWAPKAVEAVRAGRRFSSYALVIIAERAKVLVHELGHVYLGGSPHCGFDAQILSDEEPRSLHEVTGAPRWRSCFDVAALTFLSKVQAENGLPVAAYVAAAALEDVITPARSPDFSGADLSVQREELLNRPFWVTPRIGSLSCESVRSGAEYINAEVEDAIRRPASASVCVGRATWSLLDVGSVGGGVRFATSNGCACEVATVPTTTEGGSVLSGFKPGSSSVCTDGDLYARGAYVTSHT